MIVRGFLNRQIAERLVLSERTVESHVRNILDRLDLRLTPARSQSGDHHTVWIQSPTEKNLRGMPRGPLKWKP